MLARLPFISDRWMAKVGEHYRKATGRMKRALDGHPM